MRNIILENDASWSGVPQFLKEVLQTRFQENREIIYQFNDLMSINPDAGKRMLMNIMAGDNIVGQTNFHEDDQIETILNMMINFMHMGRRVNFYAILDKDVFDSVEAAFAYYVIRERAFHTPLNKDPYEYKVYMNHMLLTCLEYHNFCQIMSLCADDDRRIVYENVVEMAIKPAESA